MSLSSEAIDQAAKGKSAVSNGARLFMRVSTAEPPWRGATATWSPSSSATWAAPK